MKPNTLVVPLFPCPRSFSLLSLGLITLAFAAIATQPAEARPEYAAKEKLNCTSCHVTSWGGGPRSTYGKVYGSHGNKPSRFSESDLYYGDFRIIGYRGYRGYPPERSSTTVSGHALMEAAASANLPLHEGERGAELRSLTTFNIASLGGATPRDVYLAWQFAAEGDRSPTRLTFGRFYLPFGLLTDEHRAYTRMATDLNMENFEVGVALSGNPHQDLHYDLALVNDFRSGGTFVNEDVTLGAVANARWNPGTLPFLLGASGSYQKTLRAPEPRAFSGYAVLSLDRLTGDAIGGSLQVERVEAWNFPATSTGSGHPSLNGFFGQQLGARHRSSATYGQAKYTLNQRVVLFYRFDHLNPDTAIADNSFARHGVGVEAYLPGNVLLNLRGEKAVVAAPALRESEAMAAQDALLFMLRWWI